MLPAILICAFMVKNVATQRTATATLGTTKSCVLIGDDVKLLCTVSADCCTSLARVWEKGSAITLLDDGKSIFDPLKYEEYFDGGTTGFYLIIKNVQKSDFGVNYKCLYGATESAQFYLDDISCPPSEVDISGGCWKCAGQDYGWAFLGTVFGTVISMIIATGFIKIIAKVKSKLKKTVLIVGGLTFIISAVVNIIIALPVGYYKCHCVNWKTQWFIGVGLLNSLSIGVLTLAYMLNPGCCKVLIALCAVGSCICYTCTGKESKQDGDQELNKKDEKSQPLAE